MQQIVIIPWPAGRTSKYNFKRLISMEINQQNHSRVSHLIVGFEQLLVRS